MKTREILENLASVVALEIQSEFQVDTLVFIGVFSEAVLQTVFPTIVLDPTYKRLFMDRRDGNVFFFGLPHTHDTIRPSAPSQEATNASPLTAQEELHHDKGPASSELDASLGQITSESRPLSDASGDSDQYDEHAEFPLVQRTSRPPPLPGSPERRRTDPPPPPPPCNILSGSSTDVADSHTSSEHEAISVRDLL